jgi:hypothetical protein
MPTPVAFRSGDVGPFEKAGYQVQGTDLPVFYVTNHGAIIEKPEPIHTLLPSERMGVAHMRIGDDTLDWKTLHRLSTSDDPDERPIIHLKGWNRWPPWARATPWQDRPTQLAREIRIPGIVAAERDTDFDDEKLRSAGIRLVYPTTIGSLQGVKSGVLLEVGFDDTSPNRPVTISSWAYDTAVARGVSVRDNRALDVLCYEPSHTFVEKLQTLSTKYRGLPDTGRLPPNFLRHYYDVYCLLAQSDVLEFVGTPAYEVRKRQRFRAEDELVIARNPAFVLADRSRRRAFAAEYARTAALYYQGQPSFEDIVARIHAHIERL